MAKVKVLYQNFPRGTEENHTNVSIVDVLADSNLAFPKQKSEHYCLN